MRTLFNAAKRRGLTLWHRGSRRECPVCRSLLRGFSAYGRPPRRDARCPVCGAAERHRFMWHYIERKTDLFSGRRGRRVLHVAPEPCLEARLRERLGTDYVTADLFNPAMLRMDITAIDQPDGSFDVIFCSHVLEHVSDDKKAMREFARVLSPGGWAILLVPIIADRSHEDPTVTDPRERERLYGRSNHVRAYGPDYADRLRECGFAVAVTTPAELVSGDAIVRFGLTPAAGFIHYCTKAPR